MTTINLNKVRDLYYMNLIYEINKTRDKLDLYKKKYTSDFLSFEKKVKNASKEDFEKWDDYMEWKSYHKAYKKLLTQKRDFNEGNISRGCLKTHMSFPRKRESDKNFE